MRAYNAAWQKCLNRVRSILKALNASVVENVVQQVSGAYDDVLPGLPYPELPVVPLYGTSFALLDDIMHGIANSQSAKNDADGTPSHPTLQVHLYPPECSSVTNMMRALVTGFVDRECDKRKATSLASFDVNLLRAWYTAQDSQPRLAVFLHEFEKFDKGVVQDVFMHIPYLPLVFVLGMASPPTPPYLHSAYPRSTLALLRVQQVLAPTGVTTIKEILTRTFYDANFEPDIMLGPGALEYIVDFANRHSASPDTLLTMLQHFANPLSIFVHDNLLGQTSTHDAERVLGSSSGFSALSDALHARLLASSSQKQTNNRPQTITQLLGSVSTARAAFHRTARRMRVAFAVARIAERVASDESPNALFSGGGAEARANRLDGLEMLVGVQRSRATSQVHSVCTAVRKLSAAKLYTLVQELHTFLYGLESAATRRDEEDARLWIVQTLNECPQDMEDAQDDDAPPVQDATAKELAKNVGDWLEGYIQERLVRLEECTLWDIWHTGASPFPSEPINPAPRPTVIAALLHPHDFIRAHAGLTGTAGLISSGDEDSSGDPALWELPDTSIAFRRYVEAGRMVNVFDWFESFAVVLDNQRKQLKRRAAAAAPPTPARVNGRGKRSPVKGKGRAVNGKSKPEEHEDGEESSDESMDEEEEEQWKNEVQARFIRALHELDYMGFVKHTGRKPDHVIRTIYDVPD
ncbi:hypothetical protein L226DRAFT_469917 [Lentinus tigrinus ALCF2SS1-7]|uniref:Uncharacterized protein n=1 Tax=Lentinus tigrinus ALCF2SS1-6 TaxID=1328759 RepID=A0A5C2RRH5_9APHY|nr:hypothetical protein L227DRAFT_512764 [Lentinus tigrinus ALCF2SS1-6]RPD70525.1 hypothetical protein L226DRAFT_469917 [Lentinus tigrinus ALCF2SS1-7]